MFFFWKSVPGRYLVQKICRPKKRRHCSTSTSENWNKTWTEYSEGFGQPSNRRSDYWIGLELMHQLTKDGRPSGHKGDVTARIDLIDWNGDERFVTYSKIQIRKGDNGYALNLRNRFLYFSGFIL